eukprot:g2879.t1
MEPAAAAHVDPPKPIAIKLGDGLISPDDDNSLPEGARALDSTIEMQEPVEDGGDERTFKDVLSEIKLVAGLSGDNKDKVVTEVEEGTVFGLYFTSWFNGLCKDFTPRLTGLYETLEREVSEGKKNKRFEVIYISDASNKDKSNAYFHTMPWLGVPPASPANKQLCEMFRIDELPTLVIVDDKGKVITRDGCSRVSKDPTGYSFPWAEVMEGEGKNDGGGDKDSRLKGIAVIERSRISHKTKRDAEDSVTKLSALGFTSLGSKVSATVMTVEAVKAALVVSEAGGRQAQATMASRRESRLFDDKPVFKTKKRPRTMRWDRAKAEKEGMSFAHRGDGGEKGDFAGPAVSDGVVLGDTAVEAADGGIFYFEVDIVEDGADQVVCVGLLPKGMTCRKGRHIGWDWDTIGYHGDDGVCRANNANMQGFEAFKKGDTVGCGWDRDKHQVFFTKNGALISTHGGAPKPRPDGSPGVTWQYGPMHVKMAAAYLPCVTTRKGAVVYANFGAEPFQYAPMNDAVRGPKGRAGLWDRIEAANAADPNEESFIWGGRTDFDEKGIIYHIGVNETGQPGKYTNPANGPDPTIEVIRGPGRAGTGKPEYCLDRVPHSYMDICSGTNEYSYYAFDLKTRSVAPTHYALRHDMNPEYCLRTWCLQGSHDGRSWTVVSEHINDRSLNGAYATHTWKIQPGRSSGYGQFYRYWRILMTGKNSNDSWTLRVHGFELFGKTRRNTAAEMARGGGLRKTARFGKVANLIPAEKLTQEKMWQPDFVDAVKAAVGAREDLGLIGTTAGGGLASDGLTQYVDRHGMSEIFRNDWVYGSSEGGYCFMASEDIEVIGFGLFGGNGYYDAEVALIEGNRGGKTQGSSRQQFFLEGNGISPCLVLRQGPVAIKAGTTIGVKYRYHSRIKSYAIDEGQGRRTVQADDGTKFTFTDLDHKSAGLQGNNGTTARCGQVPRIFFRRRSSSSPTPTAVSETTVKRPGTGIRSSSTTTIPPEEVAELRGLGSGTFGEVCEGEWRPGAARGKNVIPVAIKKVLHDRCKNTAAAEDLLEEIEIATKMNSPFLAQAYGTIDMPGGFMVIMEYCYLGNLEGYLRDPTRIPLEHPEMLQLATQVMSGISFLHRFNMVHRDIAARNFLVTKDRRGSLTVKLGLVRSEGFSSSDDGSRRINFHLPPEFFEGSYFEELAVSARQKGSGGSADSGDSGDSGADFAAMKAD